MKVVGYARSSWEEERDHSFAPLDEQVDDIREFVSLMGWTLKSVFTDDPVRHGISSRNGITTLLDEIARSRRRWQCVVVSDPSRLEIKDPPLLLVDPAHELAGVLGVPVVVVDLKQARQVAARREVVQKRVARRVQKISRGHVELLAEGRREARKAGKPAGGPAPYGYRYARDGGLEPDPVESKVVERVFKAYLKSRSVKSVVRLLTAAKAPTRRGKWSAQTVANMLRNPAAIGRLRVGAAAVRGQHRAIVQIEVWDEVQAALEESRRSGRGVAALFTREGDSATV